MIIKDIEIRLCALANPTMADSEMRDGRRSNLEFIVVTINTDAGITASTFGFAGRGARMAGEIAAATLKPFFLGKDPLFRERHWHEYRMADRWWNHVPMYSYGPFDILCWVLGAKEAEQPLYRYLGAVRDRVPVYGSSLLLESPEDYARQARSVKDRGWKAYKIHPPGKPDVDEEIHRLCREAVGDDFPLMTDPVAAYTFEQALRVGRSLEKLGYRWFEEPLQHYHVQTTGELARRLDIPVSAGEQTYTVAGFTDLIAAGVRILQPDIIKMGGFTGLQQVQALAQAHGCDVIPHQTQPTIGNTANLHFAASQLHGWAPCEVNDSSGRQHALFKALPKLVDGYFELTEAPGLGIEIDEAALEARVEKLPGD